MKPRTKYEKRVAELNATLSEDIAISDYDWAKKESYKCDMGHSNYIYFTIYSNMEEFEVNRLYRLYRFTDKSTDHFFCVEIMREFIDGEKHTYFSKKRFGFGASYYDQFTIHSDIELRDNVKNYAGNMLSWLMDYSCGSHSQSTDERISCERRDCKELARVICNNPVAETLYKTNDPMFGYLMYRSYPKQICRAITLAKRHGFVFDNYTTPIWLDMVEAICYCKKDYHNPVFIAPADLMATHDKFVEMQFRKKRKDREQRERIREELRIQREYEENRKQLEADKTINEKYIKRREKFYDMVLTDGLIECRVLRDIKAFEEEGTMMHHCVFKCKYYEKPYSLILSARINDARIETIEVDLTKYRINQCYGKHDQFTMYHQRILDLVNAQMDTIKKYNRRRTTKSKIAV